VPIAILNAPAWRIMDFIARALWIELRRKLRNDGLNNGKIWLSCRDAAEQIGAEALKSEILPVPRARARVMGS
jgi:hypothetical protein